MLPEFDAPDRAVEPVETPETIGLQEFDDIGRTLVMGILNVTPDSFSDGGRWATPSAAIRRGEQMIDEGADIIDVGGESTRPGAGRVTATEEIERVIPVVQALADRIPISVDTSRADVARRALDAGARIINDVSGGVGDPDMVRVIVASGVPYICMYNNGPAALDDGDAQLSFRPAERQVYDGLTARVAELRAAGVRPEQIILDPGLGFAFAGEPNWAVLGHLDELVSLGQPVLVGASRKRFLAKASFCDSPQAAYPSFCDSPQAKAYPSFCDSPQVAYPSFCDSPQVAYPSFCDSPQAAYPSFCDSPQAKAQNPSSGAYGDERSDRQRESDAATIAVSALAAAAGAWAVRVHEVPGNLAAVRVASAWAAGQSG